MLKNLSLRTSLLLSYLFLLLMTLIVLLGAMVVLFSSVQAPPQPTYEQLIAILPGVQDDYNQRGGLVQLDSFARERDVRALVVRRVPNNAQSLVVYDTAGIYQRGDRIPMARDNPRFVSERVERFSRERRVVVGRFQDPDKQEWLFAGISVTANRPLADELSLLLAEPRPTASLQSVLNSLSNALLPPLVQAMTVGGVMALVLAFFISRNIAKPLQALSEGASAVARGDYDVRVPETGPQEVQSVAGAFNYMSEEVRNTQQAQRDFMANVSHDLKTPLTSIQGYSQAIMDGVAPDPADVAGIIHDEAARMNRMVIQLTDLARLQAGRLSMKMTALDMNNIAEAIVQRLSVVADSKQIQLHIKTQPLPTITGDGDRLAQVMTNLVSNAIKYTDPGGHVYVETQRRHDGVEIRVRDTGMGISQKELDRIFERFYQVDKARGPSRGTGLGLAITQEIVEAHGGTIQVDSPGTGQGTTFTIWLPAADASTLVSVR
jgi:signal transduction histidine kinase